MDSSLSRQTTSSLSIIPVQPLHRLKEPNDVNGAARPSEHCSKQSSDSPMPPLSSRLPAPHSSLTRNNMKGRQFPCLEESLCITASRKSSPRRLHRSAHSDSNQNDLHCR